MEIVVPNYFLIVIIVELFNIYSRVLVADPYLKLNLFGLLIAYDFALLNE